MYGLPNQTLEIWENTLDKAIAINSNHISLYGLKIEDIIKEYTNYTSVEEMRNHVESYYLYELFSKNYAKENNISEDEILNCKYTYTIKKELHTKYKLSFSNETLNELYENYMKKEKDNSTYCED